MKQLLLCLLFLAPIFPLSAQEEKEKPGSGILVRGFAFALFEETDKLELRTPERVVGELELATGQLQGGITVSARQFAFGVVEGEEFRTLGTVALPNSGKNFILVFAPTATGYHAFPVRADDPEFRGNDKYIFNFTKRRLGIFLGTARQAIAPLKNAKLRPEFPADDTFYQAMFTYEEDGKIVPFNNTRWPVNGNVKSLIFVFEDPESGKLAYRSVTELAR